MGTGFLSSSPPTPRGAPPPPPPRGALLVPWQSRVGACETKPSGSGSGRAGGQARSGPHGRLSLRCCCCCCWRLSSSAPWARAGRRPPTPPQKVLPSPATRALFHLTRPFPAPPSLWPSSLSGQPYIASVLATSLFRATLLLLTSFLSPCITTQHPLSLHTLLHHTTFL